MSTIQEAYWNAFLADGTYALDTSHRSFTVARLSPANTNSGYVSGRRFA